MIEDSFRVADGGLKKKKKVRCSPLIRRLDEDFSTAVLWQFFEWEVTME